MSSASASCFEKAKASASASASWFDQSFGFVPMSGHCLPQGSGLCKLLWGKKHCRCIPKITFYFRFLISLVELNAKGRWVCSRDVSLAWNFAFLGSDYFWSVVEDIKSVPSVCPSVCQRSHGWLFRKWHHKACFWRVVSLKFCPLQIPCTQIFAPLLDSSHPCSHK